MGVLRHIAEIRNFGDRGSVQNFEALLLFFQNSKSLAVEMFLPGAEGAQKLTLYKNRSFWGGGFGVKWGRN